MKKNTLTEENYLKCIFKNLEEKNTPVETNTIAFQLNAKPASVTDMLKKLSSKKMIQYKKYYGVTLTKTGKKIALNVIRKHRLWEFFLVQKLNFKWDEVHDIAEQLEHTQSDELIKRLDHFLGFPKFDPHGDPIPDEQGKIMTKETILLADLPEHKTATMAGVLDHSTLFLQQLNSLNIKIGVVLRVNVKNKYDHSIQLSINKKKSSFLSNDIAKNILVTIN